MTAIDQQIPPANTERYIAGDDVTIEVTVTTDNGEPKSLTGASVTFAVAEYRGDEPLFTRDTDDGIIIVDASAGRLNINVTGEQTASLGAADGDSYHYELSVTDDGGTSVTVSDGSWIIYSTSIESTVA